MPTNLMVYVKKQKMVISQVKGLLIFNRYMQRFGKKIVADLPKDCGIRDYATLVALLRKKPPLKVKPHPGPLKTDSDGTVELRDVDYSGKNHYLIGDIDTGINSSKIKVHAIASTKDTPYEDVNPIKISDTTLDGQDKSQYYHEKDNTCIAKDAVEVHPLATHALQNNTDFIKHSNRIKIEKNLE